MLGREQAKSITNGCMEGKGLPVKLCRQILKFYR